MSKTTIIVQNLRSRVCIARLFYSTYICLRMGFSGVPLEGSRIRQEKLQKQL